VVFVKREDGRTISMVLLRNVSQQNHSPTAKHQKDWHEWEQQLRHACFIEQRR
jgi:hypothetical protein